MRQYVTVSEYCQLTGAKRKTVYAHLKQGKIPHERSGATYLIPVGHASKVVNSGLESGDMIKKAWEGMPAPYPFGSIK